MYKNSESYPNSTAGAACSTIRWKERQQEADRLAAISALIPVIKGVAEPAGFEIVCRITLKDKITGKEYR